MLSRHSKNECLTMVSKASVDFSWVCDDSPLQFDPGSIRDRFTEAEKGSLSATGRILFLQEEVPPPTNKKVLLFRKWEKEPAITRAMKALCPVQNCRFVMCGQAVVNDINERFSEYFPASLLSGGKYSCTILPSTISSPLYIESRLLLNVCLCVHRSDTDVFFPHGYTVLANDSCDEAIERVKNKTKLLAHLRSNCGGKSGLKLA